MTDEEPIYIHDHVDAICQDLGIDSTYVAALHIEPYKLTATIYKGRDGRFKGPKHLDETREAPAQEDLTFEVRA